MNGDIIEFYIHLIILLFLMSFSPTWVWDIPIYSPLKTLLVNLAYLK